MNRLWKRMNMHVTLEADGRKCLVVVIHIQSGGEESQVLLFFLLSSSCSSESCSGHFFCYYSPFISHSFPQGLRWRALLSAFKLGTVKLKCLLKVVLFPYLSLLNPWVIPSFSYHQSQGSGGLRHFALLAPLILQTILEKDGHMFLLEPRELVRLSTFPSQGDRKSLRNTQRFMRSENNNFLIGFI